MASCFLQTPITEEDSAILFSTSASAEGSSSSSSFRQSPTLNHPKSAYKLTVKNLSYTIHKTDSFLGRINKTNPIDVLKSVSFTSRSSEILAVVGPSGTGKSSLLRVIAGRVKENRFRKETIFLNDHPILNPSQLKKICGFVAQEDNLLPLLTVKETLMFSAKFRLKNMFKREKEDKVEALMHELGLLHVANSYVGDEENRGISGGERKRVSIGVDMIHDPPILLLDEPTSGLDSSSALQVIELLSSMAKSKDRIIMLSIHQPSYRMFHHISNYLILSNGSIAHHGSMEALEETISQLGFEIPTQLNALEFSMEIMNVLVESNSHKMQDEDSSSSGYSPWRNDIKTAQLNFDKVETNGVNYFSTKDEIMVLCIRFFKIIYRTKQLFLARTMQAIIGGFGLGTVFLKMKKDQSGVAERLGLFAFSLSFLLSSTVEALPIYLQERKVLMKEASRGAYRVSSYMIANTIIFLPFLFAVSILFSVPVYWLVGLNPSASAFAFFVFVVWMIVLMASSLVMFLSSISPDFISGNSLICTVLGAFFLFSGYFIPKESIPKYWIFMYYVSLYRYSLDSLFLNEYWGMRHDCFSWRREDNVDSCVLTGEDVLKNRGLLMDSRWMNVGIMFGFFVFYRVLCWIILSRRVSRTTV